MNTGCLGIEFPSAKERKNWRKKNGKMMSMDRMKYLSTDFLVYQLLERKVIFLNTRRLDCFWIDFRPTARKVETPNWFFICS